MEKKPEPIHKHDPKTMSFPDAKKEPVKTDRGDFAFLKHAERD